MTIFTFLLMGLVGCGGGESTPVEAPAAPTQEQTTPSEPTAAAGGGDGTPIRIGWQETWATQGQLAVIL